jgi:hypothetical protein
MRPVRQFNGQANRELPVPNTWLLEDCFMSSVQRVLYFRQAPHDSYLVFASPDRALFIDQIHRAIEESCTWGEFRRRLPAGEYQKLYQDQFSSDPEIIADDDSAREPADDDGFPNDVPGYCDGDYPGGHLKIPHPWAGQTPPPDGGGTRDDYAV